MAECHHLEDISSASGILGVAPRSNGCEDCLPQRTDWIHLRRCLECGRILCCESSPKKHARAHAGATGHALIQSFEPGEDWVWCYVDGVILKPADGVDSPSHDGSRGL
jgi:hypothetical protein